MIPIPRPVLAALFCLAALSPAWAGAPLAPASPQPDPALLAPGLAVRYAYPSDVRSLHDARSWLKRSAEAGPPLSGLDYPDAGGKALTSRQVQRVIADITGYIRFDAAGDYKLEFQSNDGLEVEIGGTRVYRDDNRHPCSSRGARTVTVPQPGWYALHALFFQRLNTSCLRLRWQPPGGELVFAPTTNFAHAAP